MQAHRCAGESVLALRAAATPTMPSVSLCRNSSTALPAGKGKGCLSGAACNAGMQSLEASHQEGRAWPGRSSQHHRQPAAATGLHPWLWNKDSSTAAYTSAYLQHYEEGKGTHLHHLLDARSKCMCLALQAHDGQCSVKLRQCRDLSCTMWLKQALPESLPCACVTLNKPYTAARHGGLSLVWTAFALIEVCGGGAGGTRCHPECASCTWRPLGARRARHA